MKEYQIPENQFICRSFTSCSKTDWTIIFTSLLIPIKNRKRNKRFFLFRTVKYPFNVVDEFKKREIEGGKNWMRKHLKESIEKGIIKYGNNNKPSLQIDLNKLNQIKFVTKDKISFRKIENHFKKQKMLN